jgi:hypothetical protein
VIDVAIEPAQARTNPGSGRREWIITATNLVLELLQGYTTPQVVAAIPHTKYSGGKNKRTYDIGDEMKDLKNVIERSRDILNIGTNAPTDVTWIRATEFLCKMAEQFKEDGGHTFFPPEISAGTNGSIDLVFTNLRDNAKLSVKFPASPGEHPVFDGIDAFGKEEKRELKGSEEYVFAARWLLFYRS